MNHVQIHSTPYERVLRTTSSSLRSDGAAFWVAHNGQLRQVAQYGMSAGQARSITLPDDLATRSYAFTSDDGRSFGMPVRHQGALVGALVVCADTRREWSSADAQLLADHAETAADLLELDLWRAREDSARSQAETQYRALFERSRDAIYMTTRDGRFIDANPAMLELFGYARAELLAMNAADLYADKTDRNTFQKQIERAGFVREHALQMKRKDGKIVHVLKTASVDRDASGAIIGYQGILHDVTAQKRREEELRHNAFHDALTGLPNRTLLLEHLNRLERAARRHRHYQFALMFMDLDRFKIINDSMGHQVGDELLISVARRLERCVRQEDTVARLGGDEFAVIVDAINDPSQATRVADRILRELQLPFQIAGRDIMTGASIGIALSITGYNNVDAMMRDADSAMYRAKSGGRNRYEVFDLAMHDEAANLLRLEADLAQAVTRDEFALEYLPVYKVPERKLAGLEALVRWHHPERGKLAPGQFIEAAEDSGLIVPIGWWVMRHACEQLRAWQQQYAAARKIALSVNVSGRQFLQQDLVPQIDAILRDTGLEPQYLRLEIAEKDIMRNADPAVAVLAALDKRGIQLGIDDFGTGYSSLSYLQRFPLDSFKIDRSFVSQLGKRDERSAGLVRAILALGRSLNIPAVAEGVETEAQLEELQQLGVQYAQGFLFSTPLPAEAVPTLLKNG